jgi:hypothetical protein
VGKGTDEMKEIAAPTIAAAQAISRAVRVPVMCASGALQSYFLIPLIFPHMQRISAHVQLLSIHRELF